MAAPEIDIQKVEFIIEKAREFEIPEAIAEDQEEIAEPDIIESGSSALAAAELDELARRQIDDPAFSEARSHINDMNIDEQCQLVALAWVGRGDFTASDWDDAVRTARDEHNNRTAEYLFGMPHLPDYLEAGLEAFGLYESDGTED